ncbi:MAG: type II secretion system F family protein [Methanobrevibacter sp.]|jgi:flagellar protein FlaJ|nr:type II secretion system F family protein [Methanobrevibacter sp.]
MQISNINKINKSLAKIIENYIPNNYLIILNNYLEKNGIGRDSCEIISQNLIAIVLLSIVTILLSLIFNANILITIPIAIVCPPCYFLGKMVLSSQRRKEEIEKATPDFLRQLASMLRVGMGFESALGELSKFGQGPLHEEIKRATVEMKVGHDFDTSIMKIPEKLNSKELKRTFRMIVEGKKSGGSLADIIDSVSEDLRATIELKRERKSTVMMSVMFLIISAVIAAPFALGMIGVYSSFLANLGKESELIKTAIVAAGAYIIIHSTLAGFIIGVIMYGDFKKGLKYSFPLAIVSYIVFYSMSTIGPMFLGINI